MRLLFCQIRTMKHLHRKLPSDFCSRRCFFCATARRKILTQIGVTLLRDGDDEPERHGHPRGAAGGGYERQRRHNWEVNPGAASASRRLFSPTFPAAGSTQHISQFLGLRIRPRGRGGAEIFTAFPAAWPRTSRTWTIMTRIIFINYDHQRRLLPPNINDRGGQPKFHLRRAIRQPISRPLIRLTTITPRNTTRSLFPARATADQPVVSAPATCYNGIGVGAYGGDSSVGPTLDNGRCKPDITAPGGRRRVFPRRIVAGAAAVLMQAGLRGDGGSDTNSAADIRTMKALLLNGAIKPADWTNNPPSPLDARYGAGVLNVFNSYEQLAGGKHGYIVSTTVSTGGAHPPTGATGTVGVLSGWDFNTNTSSSPSQRRREPLLFQRHQRRRATRTFTATATLVWNRQQNKTAINNLDLFLIQRRQQQPRRLQHEPRGQRRAHLRAATCARPLRFAGLESAAESIRQRPAKPTRWRGNFSRSR